MAKYPIKMLKDEEGTPFVPLVSTEAVRTPGGETVKEELGKKLEVSNIVAGTDISLSVDGNNITINNTSSKYSIKDTRSEEAKAIFKEWRQEILDTGAIPPITYHVTDSYMLYLTDVFIRGDSVSTAVLRFKGRGDNGEYNGYRVYYETIIFDTTTGEVSSYKNGYSTDEYEVIAYGGMSPNPKKALTTDNTNSYTPTSDYHPATKKYVDDNKYTLPIASTESLGGVKIGDNLNIDENGMISALDVPIYCVDSKQCTKDNPFVFEGKPKGIYCFVGSGDNASWLYYKGLNSDTKVDGNYYGFNNNIIIIINPITEDMLDGTVVALGLCDRYRYPYSYFKKNTTNDAYSSIIEDGGTKSGDRSHDVYLTNAGSETLMSNLRCSKAPTEDNQYSNKKYVDDSITTAIAGITQFSLVPVDTLPTENIRTDAIYAIPSDNPQEQDVRIEYVYINDSWEILGTTKIDLSNYYTKEEIDIKLGELHNLINTNTTVATSEEVTNILNGIATNGEVTK